MRVGVYIQPMLNQEAGIHQFVRQLVDALVVHGRSEYVLFGTSTVQSPLEQVRLSPSALSMANPFRYGFGRGVSCRKYGLDWMFDTTHFGTMGLFRDVRKCRVIHDLTPLKFPHFHRLKTVVGHRLLFHRAVAESDVLITPSRFTENDLRQAYPQARNVYTIYPGLDSQVLSEIGQKRGNHFLMVGTAEPRKNHATAIAAFDLLCALGVDAKFMLVGQRGWGVDLDKLVAQSSFSDRITHRGFVSREELARLYNTALALVYPSFYEGLGLPVLEAMKTGCPVITTRGSAMHEAGGDAVLCADSHSPAEIAEMMERVFRDGALRQELSRKGQERARLFSWENFVGRLEEILESSAATKAH